MKIILYIIGILVGLGFLFNFGCLVSYVQYMSSLTKARKREEEQQTKLLQDIVKYKEAEQQEMISLDESRRTRKDVTINLN